jgi:condensin complex subunit 3
MMKVIVRPRWTDPRKCYVSGNQLIFGDEGTKRAVNGDVHLEFARDLLEKLGSNISSKWSRLSPSLQARIVTMI